jgi:ubiquinol-cytochrome c reductase cytochrome c subunit
MKASRVGVVLIILAAGGAAVACAYVGGRTEPYLPPAIARTPPPQEGKTLYLRTCAWCHGDRGQGTSRAPDVVSGTNGAAFTHFMLSTGRMPLDFPREAVDREEPVFNSDQIAEITEYIQSLGAAGPPVPQPDPGAGVLGLGAELYQDNCAACHATTGIGAALTTGGSGELQGAVARRSGIVAPSLESSTPTQIAEAMLVGPGTMPVFGAQTFDDREVNSIVRYVTYLQSPDERGGLPMGRVGPWSEGAAGWIIGLGVLLVLVRWIGTRVGE